MQQQVSTVKFESTIDEGLLKAKGMADVLHAAFANNGFDMPNDASGFAWALADTLDGVQKARESLSAVKLEEKERSENKRNEASDSYLETTMEIVFERNKLKKEVDQLVAQEESIKGRLNAILSNKGKISRTDLNKVFDASESHAGAPGDN